jgi:hypothetical protein
MHHPLILLRPSRFHDSSLRTFADLRFRCLGFQSRLGPDGFQLIWLHAERFYTSLKNAVRSFIGSDNAGHLYPRWVYRRGCALRVLA